MRFLVKILFDESGQGLVEYSLIISLVALAIISAVILFRDSLVVFYETIKEDVINAL